MAAKLSSRASRPASPRHVRPIPEHGGAPAARRGLRLASSGCPSPAVVGDVDLPYVSKSKLGERLQ